MLDSFSGRSLSAFPAARQLLLIGGSLLMAACSSMVKDSGPDRHVDVSLIQDPVPRVEPISKYGNPSSYVVQGRRYYIKPSASGYYQEGIASWYGTKFHGERTSSGEPYDMYAMTAAHKTLPIPVYAEVTNLDTGKKIIVRINDRGPFVDGRIIDLSYVAAKKLGIAGQGTGRVSVRTLDPRRYAPAPVAQQVAQISLPLAVEGAPQPVAMPAADQPLATIPAGQLYLQVGAFTEQRNAAQLAQQLVTSTTENVLINRKTAAEYDLYRVRIGPLQSEADAERLRQQLSNVGIDSSHLVVE